MPMYKFLGTKMSISKSLGILSFSDSLLQGLTVPFTSFIIIKLGGSFTVAGILASMIAIVEVITPYFTSKLINRWGFNRSFAFVLFLNFLSFFVLRSAVSKDFMVACCGRLIYDATHHTAIFCNAFLLKEEESSKRRTKFILDLINCTGFVFGTMISGVLLTQEDGLQIVSSIALGVSLLNIAIPLLLMADLDVIILDCDPLEDFRDSMSNLSSVDFRQWSILLVKYFTTMGRIAYFSRLSLLIHLNKDVKLIVVGINHSLNAILTLASNSYITFWGTNGFVSINELSKHIANYFLFASVLCSSPSLHYYFVAVLMFILSDTYVENKWPMIFERASSDEIDIKKASKATDVLCKTITPTALGMHCDKYRHNAVAAFCLASFSVASVISYCVPKVKQD